MRCTKCSMELKTDSNFCSKCGIATDASQQKPVKESTVNHKATDEPSASNPTVRIGTNDLSSQSPAQPVVALPNADGGFTMPSAPLHSSLASGSVVTGRGLRYGLRTVLFAVAAIGALQLAIAVTTVIVMRSHTPTPEPQTQQMPQPQPPLRPQPHEQAGPLVGDGAIQTPGVPSTTGEQPISESVKEVTSRPEHGDAVEEDGKEIAAETRKLEELKRQVATETRKLEGLVKEIALEERNLNHLKTEVARGRRNLNQLKTETARGERNLNQLKMEIAHGGRNLNKLKTERALEERKRKEVRAEIALEERRLKGLTTQVAKAERKVNKLKRDVAGIKIADGGRRNRRTIRVG